MHGPRGGHFHDKCSQSCDKSKKDRIGGPLAQKVERNVRRERRPMRRDLHQIAVGRFSNRCDDCCVSLHRSGHPVDPGVGWGRELRGLPWRPPLPRHWQRCSIEPFWLLGRICFQPPATPLAPDTPWSRPNAVGISWLRKTHRSPYSLYCPLWVTRVLTTRWSWNSFVDINP